MAQRALLLRQAPVAAAAAQELRVPLALRVAVALAALGCQIQLLDLLYSMRVVAAVVTTQVLVAQVEMAAVD